VAIRCDRDLPDGPRPPAAIGKPVRTLGERASHALYQSRNGHLPLGGRCGVDQWSPDEVVSHSAWIEIPLAAAPGCWQVEVRMTRQPHNPNLHPSDGLSDRDLYAGVPAGTLEVVARTASATAAPDEGGPPVRH
jgi:hypothetical protein